MDEIVDARDVLDANARTRCAFQARILGHFHRVGPNKWDPYRFVNAECDRGIEVLPGLKIQVEEHGAVFRVRSHGRVLRAEWVARGSEQDGPGSDARSRFMQTCVAPYRNAPGRGFKAMIMAKLKGRRRRTS